MEKRQKKGILWKCWGGEGSILEIPAEWEPVRWRMPWQTATTFRGYTRPGRRAGWARGGGDGCAAARRYHVDATHPARRARAGPCRPHGNGPNFPFQRLAHCQKRAAAPAGATRDNQYSVRCDFTRAFAIIMSIRDYKWAFAILQEHSRF